MQRVGFVSRVGTDSTKFMNIPHSDSLVESTGSNQRLQVTVGFLWIGPIFRKYEQVCLGIHAGENKREQKMNKNFFLIIFQWYSGVLQKENKSGTFLSIQAVLEK